MALNESPVSVFDREGYYYDRGIAIFNRYKAQIMAESEILNELSLQELQELIASPTRTVERFNKEYRQLEQEIDEDGQISDTVRMQIKYILSQHASLIISHDSFCAKMLGHSLEVHKLGQSLQRMKQEALEREQRLRQEEQEREQKLRQEMQQQMQRQQQEAQEWEQKLRQEMQQEMQQQMQQQMTEFVQLLSQQGRGDAAVLPAGTATVFAPAMNAGLPSLPEDTRELRH